MHQSKAPLFRLATCLATALMASLALAQMRASARSVRSGSDEYVYIRVWNGSQEITQTSLTMINMGHCSGYKCSRTNPNENRGEIGLQRVNPTLIRGEIRIRLIYTPGSAIQFYDPRTRAKLVLATWN